MKSQNYDYARFIPLFLGTVLLGIFSLACIIFATLSLLGQRDHDRLLSDIQERGQLLPATVTRKVAYDPPSDRPEMGKACFVYYRIDIDSEDPSKEIERQLSEYKYDQLSKGQMIGVWRVDDDYYIKELLEPSTTMTHVVVFYFIAGLLGLVAFFCWRSFRRFVRKYGFPEGFG